MAARVLRDDRAHQLPLLDAIQLLLDCLKHIDAERNPSFSDAARAAPLVELRLIWPPAPNSSTPPELASNSVSQDASRRDAQRQEESQLPPQAVERNTAVSAHNSRFTELERRWCSLQRGVMEGRSNHDEKVGSPQMNLKRETTSTTTSDGNAKRERLRSAGCDDTSAIGAHRRAAGDVGHNSGPCSPSTGSSPRTDRSLAHASKHDPQSGAEHSLLVNSSNDWKLTTRVKRDVYGIIEESPRLMQLGRFRGGHRPRTPPAVVSLNSLARHSSPTSRAAVSPCCHASLVTSNVAAPLQGAYSLAHQSPVALPRRAAVDPLLSPSQRHPTNVVSPERQQEPQLVSPARSHSDPIMKKSGQRSDLIISPPRPRLYDDVDLREAAQKELNFIGLGQSSTQSSPLLLSPRGAIETSSASLLDLAKRHPLVTQFRH